MKTLPLIKFQMKKLFLTALVFSAFQFLHAQVCVPGTITSPNNAYILPDSATNFNWGCIGQTYEQILYIKAAKDTTIAVTTPIAALLTADIDSFVVDANIGGLPAYLSTASVPAVLPPSNGDPKTNYSRLVIPGDSLACVKISGTIPMSQSAGNIPLTVNLRVYTSNIHCPGNAVVDALIPTFYPGNKTDTVTAIKYYSITMQSAPCWPLSVTDIRTNERLNFVPNPADANTTILLNSTTREQVKLIVSDMLGRIIYQDALVLQEGKNSIPLRTSGFQAGLYQLTISSGTTRYLGKLEVSH